MSSLARKPQYVLPHTFAELFPLYNKAERAATSPDTSDEDSAAWCDRLGEFEAAIVSSPAVRAEDVASKVSAVSALGGAQKLDGPNATDLWAQLRTVAGVAA